jgi:hypothetical protein
MNRNPSSAVLTPVLPALDTLSPIVEASSQHWHHSFQNPPLAYRPVPFWSWNEILEPAEVRRQLQLFAKAGWGGAFIHSRPGLLTPYMREEWFAAVDAAVDESRKLGLNVWLYDEDGWPSGFSGGSVPQADPAFRHKAIIARAVGSEPPPGATAIGNPTDGIQVYTWTAPLGDDRYMGLAYVDLLHRDAIRQFLNDAYETYHARYGDEYGRCIAGEFFDEPRVLEFFGRLPAGAMPFGATLLERFKQMHGYDAREHLHLLFTANPDAPRFRLHYHRTVSDLFEHNFAKQVGDWCESHGISSIGHFMWEESLHKQQLMGVNFMPSYRHITIPGIDHLCLQVDERLTAKQCQSVVNQYGKRRMMSELFGAGGQAMTFEDRLWISYQQLCLGVNFLVPHLALYTMTGMRKLDHPPAISYQQPWWPLNQVFEERISRLSAALSQGRYHAEMLVLHPRESAAAVWESQRCFDKTDKLVRHSANSAVTADARDQIEQLDDEFRLLLDQLFFSQRTFDLGDEQILTDAGSVVFQRNRVLLRVGEMSYPLVVIPSMITIRPQTLRLLKRFHDAGGIIVCAGQQPSLVDGMPDTAALLWLESLPHTEIDALSRTLPTHGAAELEWTDSSNRQLLVHLRDLEDGSRLVFVVNLDRLQKASGKLRLRGGWNSAQLLDPGDGSFRPVRVTEKNQLLEIPLELEPAQSVLLTLSKDADSNSEEPVPYDLVASLSPRRVSLGDWKVERLDDNAMVLDYARWALADGAWSSGAAPVIALQDALNQQRYSGWVSLQYTVNAKKLSQEKTVRLIVENHERFAIRVNGKRVEYDGLPFQIDFRWLPIDITGLLINGANIIELTCDRFVYGGLAKHDDLEHRYGSEIGAIYLLGDFAVMGSEFDAPITDEHQQRGLPTPDLRCFESGSFYLTDPTPLSVRDVTNQGLPFYAGRLCLTANWPPSADGILDGRFAIERLDACVAELAVDHAVVGHLLAKPLQISLSRSQLAGGSQFCLTLYGDLRNLFGPHHLPNTEPFLMVSPQNFRPSFASGVDRLEILRHWGRSSGVDAWSDHYRVRSFGNAGSLAVE